MFKFKLEIWFTVCQLCMRGENIQWDHESNTKKDMCDGGTLKFIYSEKATKFCETFTLLLTVCTVVKSKVKISQKFVAFLEYMNFRNFSEKLNYEVCT